MKAEWPGTGAEGVEGDVGGRALSEGGGMDPTTQPDSPISRTPPRSPTPGPTVVPQGLPDCTASKRGNRTLSAKNCIVSDFVFCCIDEFNFVCCMLWNSNEN